MWAALFSFLGSLVSALPKILEAIRDWRIEKQAIETKAKKDERNARAISDAIAANSSPSDAGRVSDTPKQDGSP
jgi:hypothetical protein